MALNKKLIHFNSKNNFMSEKNGVNNSPETPTGEDGTYGQIKGTSIVFIKDSGEIWTHGNLYRSVNWTDINENTEAIRNEKLYEILNSVYEPITELDTKTATSIAIVSLLKQTY